ncbi:hypothetical protein GCM10027592_58580 [Spirosoma flavus]
MPKIYLVQFVLALLLSFNGFAFPLPTFANKTISSVQSFTLPTPTVRWQTIIGGSYFDNATSMAASADSTYIVVGSIASTNGDMAGDPLSGKVLSAAWAAKINKLGNKIWFKSFALFSNTQYSQHGASQVVTLADGSSVIIAAANYSIATPKYIPWVFKLDANGNQVWEKTFNSSSSFEYYAQSITVDPNGNYVLAGWVKKPSNTNLGTYDYWIIKLNPEGELIWEKTFGGSSNELPGSVIALPEGGYVIAGYSASTDGDVTTTHDAFNCWILKLDTNGNKIWQKTYGGSYNDRAISIIRTPAGEFVVAGYTSSGDGDVTGYHGTIPPSGDNNFFGDHDFWILKLNREGGLIWQKTLGGFDDDMATSIALTNNNEYLITGSTQSPNGDVIGYHTPADRYVNQTDAWVIKLDSTGTLIWQKALGGSKGEGAAVVLPTSNGGSIVAGYAESTTGDVTSNRGYSDVWIVRLNGPADPGCISTTDGMWSSVSTWSCGRVPTATDVVHLKHRITIPDNYEATARRLIYDLPIALKWGEGSRLLIAQ